MRWFSRKVTVNLIDDATGAAFTATQMSPEDLPESFETATTLHIGDAEWSVVQADPPTRLGYTRSGWLTLRLRRVEMIDPRDILFSLPSICDRLAPLGAAPLVGDEYLLVEDDWRQLELVSRQFAAECDTEIAAIRRIHEQSRAEYGWREIHVRRQPDPPITGALTLKDLQGAFGGVALQGVTYEGASSAIESGFAFTSPDGLICYGTTFDGRVTVLGVGQDAVQPPPHRSAAALAQIARDFELDLVHWCRCGRFSWDDERFHQLVIGD